MTDFAVRMHRNGGPEVLQYEAVEPCDPAAGEARVRVTSRASASNWLTRIFRDAHWIAPADRRLQLDVLRAWNQDHPLTQFAIAWRRDEWPQIDHWATPTFYFFARGDLVAKVSGWPDEGRHEELMAAARAAGIASVE